VKVRVSIGTLALIRGEGIKQLAPPTTAYMLQFSESGCAARCAFCPQSSASRAPRDRLSRVLWPAVKLEEILPRLRIFRRLCMQSVIKPGFVEELGSLLDILSGVGRPISLAVTPIPLYALRRLVAKGVDYLGVGLDAFTPRIFREIMKPYSWSTYISFVKRGVEVLGRGHVVVHLIAGLGEGLREAIDTMRILVGIGARIALFAFTPVKGTPLEKRAPPPLRYYRSLQLARLLIERGYDIYRVAEIRGDELRIRSGPWLRDVEEAFLTSGCPDCNRPFFNESPRGPLYNIPSRQLLEATRAEWSDFLRGVVL